MVIWFITFLHNILPVDDKIIKIETSRNILKLYLYFAIIFCCRVKKLMSLADFEMNANFLKRLRLVVKQRILKFFALDFSETKKLYSFTKKMKILLKLNVLQ